MGKLSQFRIDVDKSVDGIWRKFGSDIEVKIARWNNPAFKNYLAELRAPYLNQLRRRTDDKELERTIDDLDKKAAARFVIRDWKNMEDDGGKAIAYTPEKAFEFISDPAYEYFYNYVFNVSNNIDLFFEEQKEDAVKN